KYISLEYETELEKLEFGKSRKKDYCFDNKFHLTRRYEVGIPEGYQIKHLPSGFTFSNENFSVKINYERVNNSIIYYKEISIDNPVIKVEKFDEWDKISLHLNKVFEDHIILSKL